MPDLTYFDSLTPSRPWEVLILVLLLLVCLVLLIELSHGLDPSTRRELIDVFLASFRRGLRQGWRGQFAPLRRRPWQAAWNAWRAPEGHWWGAVIVWCREIERMIDEQH